MNRIASTCACSLLALCASITSAQPNIVWIIADDLSQDLGAYGYGAVDTPNIDRLAAEGVRYNNAFATSPVCSASRSAIITGMYATTIGAQSHRLTSSTKQSLPAGVSPITEYFRQEGYYVTNANAGVTGGGKTDYNFNSGVSGGMYDGFDWANRAQDQPFFAQVQIFDPHRDFRKNTDFTRLNDVTFPSYYPDHPVTRADWANYLVSVEELDRKVGVILDRLENEGLMDDTIVMFFGDHGRPHVRDKQWLYDGGIRVPLIVRDPTASNPGTVEEDAVSLIDVGVGSLALTGATLPPHLQGVNMFDPAFEGRDAIFAGRDRSGNVQDRVRSVQVGDLKLIRNYDPSLSYMKGSQESFYKRLEYPVHTLLLELEEAGQLTPAQAKLLATSRPPEELYDLANDPEELNNLAADPNYATALTDLRSRLDTWVQQTDDAGLYPLDPAVENGLIQSSINWGTNQLANRGFSVDGDRTLELRWWEEQLGVQVTAVPSGQELKVGLDQSGNFPPNGGTITTGSFSSNGSGVSPALGGSVGGIVEAQGGSIVSGLGQIAGHLTAESGSVIQIGGSGISTATGGQISTEDFESFSPGDAFTAGTSTGLLPGWSFVDLAPSTGSSVDSTFAVIDTATDSSWTQSSARSQMLAQTSNPIDFLRQNDTSGEVIAGALAIAGVGSGIDSSNTVDVIDADFVWGDALGDGSGSFLDSKLIFGYQDENNFLSLAIVKGQASGADTQIDIRVISGGQVTDVFGASGTGDFSSNFPDTNAVTNGLVHVRLIHDSASGFVFFELVDGENPSTVYATATVSDPLLAVEGLVGFGVNNDAGAWDNLNVVTQSALPAAGLQILGVGGNFVQESGATLEVDLLSTEIHDHLQVAGNATLAGQLSVTLSEGYVPSLGDSFQLVGAGGTVAGVFDTMTLPSLPGGLAFAVQYGPSAVTLVVEGIAGDYNLDGIVDGSDYAVWRNSLGQTGNGLAADGNADGVINAADLNVWMANYGSTTPPAGQVSHASATPEPNTAALLISSGLFASQTYLRRERKSPLRTPDSGSGATQPKQK